MLMKKLLLSLGVIISLTSVLWGTNLIHESYTLGKDSTLMLKSGTREVSSEVSKFHSLQSSKELAVHLGLVIVGVSFLTLTVTRKLST